MTRRLRIPILTIAGVLAVGMATVATAGGTGAFQSASRATVAPPPKPRVQKPKASALAQVRALERQLANAKADMSALKKALAKATKPAQKAALKKSLAKASAKVKNLEKALAKAKAQACNQGYSLIGNFCVANG